MSFRRMLTLLVFAAGGLGLLAMLVDRTLSTQGFLYTRAETRARVLAESISAVTLPHLKEGAPLDVTALDHLARLPDIDYIVVSGRDDRPVYANTSHPERYRQESRDDRLPLLHEIRDEEGSYGTLRLGLSLRAIHVGLREMLARGLGLAAFSLTLLAMISWYVGSLFGRQMDYFVQALESMDSVTLPRILRCAEMSRVLAAFEALRKRLSEEAARREQVEKFKNDLTNMIIHDLKHPLAVLKTVLSMMSSKEFEAQLAMNPGNAMRMANKSIHRLNAMIEDMLQVARLNNTDVPIAVRHVPLDVLLGESAEESALIVQQDKRAFHTDFSAEALARSVSGDRSMLKRLIGNLILNAVEYSPLGTAVTLGARIHPQDPSEVEVFVHDQGPGLTQKHLQMLFNKYASSGKGAGNAGLGLAFCRLAAERHGGQILVESSEQSGTTFTLRIPTTDVRGETPVPEGLS